jgi:glutathione peroxidase
MHIMNKVLLLAGLIGLIAMIPAQAEQCPDFLDHEFRKLHSSETVNLCRQFGGKPLLIVNTASYCGFTSQFEGLEALHREYGPKGLVVLGFPSDDFRQEADSEAETAKVCYINYGVSFTMLAPGSVKGDQAHPLFTHLARESRAPRWNFTKYLVDPEGRVVQRFDTTVEPESPELTGAVEELL